MVKITLDNIYEWMNRGYQALLKGKMCVRNRAKQMLLDDRHRQLSRVVRSIDRKKFPMVDQWIPRRAFYEL